MSRLMERLVAQGGVASTATLLVEGVTNEHIDEAVRQGIVQRVRRGWVALPDAPSDVTGAVRVGGRLSCLSLLKRENVWCARDSRLHIRVPATAQNLSSPHDRRIPLGRPERFGIALHRSHRADLPEPEGPVDSFPWALLHAITCQPRDDAIVTLDSALHSGRVSRTELEFLTVHLPAKFRRYLELTDPNAASGLETKARLGLHGSNIPYRSQVQIPGVGRVDLLVGDRLVVETDGRAWHSGPDAYAVDRRRDLALMELGYAVLRLSYDQVMGEWPRVIAVIRALVGRQEHRWSPRHVKEGLAVRL